MSIHPENTYESRIRDETSRYESCLEVHHLPPIFHYWSNRYIRPLLHTVGIDGPDAMFRDYLRSLCTGAHREFLSIGSGNCDLEVGVAAYLRSQGHSDFVIECLELNGAMLERGRQAAIEAGVTGQLRFTQADFNEWKASRAYDAAVANQSLHHVLNLEALFAEVEQALTPQGLFLISDMIGRNGHRRWPEALAIVQEFWKELPPSYRYNQSLNRYEAAYENWDCSKDAFEGIRSQDVLPLLLERFHPHLFVGFGNVIDVFTDRAFGFHFDAAAEWDRRFIDEIHRRDDCGIRAGQLTPTHMIAVFGRSAAEHPRWNLEPRKCVRVPEPPDALPDENGASAYEWRSWPHAAQTQLEIACRNLEKVQGQVADRDRELEARTLWARRSEALAYERTEWAVRLDQEVEERTAWALNLDRELKQAEARARALQSELDDRTEWAINLDRECTLRAERAQQLDEELKTRTEWALRLQRELDEERGWRRKLEVALHNPGRLALQLGRVILKRIRHVAGLTRNQ